MSVVAFADPAGWPSTNTTPQVKELKNFSKKFEKPLTDPAECGIIRVSRGVRNRIWLR
jgi:hypothetical protein